MLQRALKLDQIRVDIWTLVLDVIVMDLHALVDLVHVIDIHVHQKLLIVGLVIIHKLETRRWILLLLLLYQNLHEAIFRSSDFRVIHLWTIDEIV